MDASGLILSNDTDFVNSQIKDRTFSCFARIEYDNNYEWYLVEDSFADFLIDNKETILVHNSSYWWKIKKNSYFNAILLILKFTNFFSGQKIINF